MNHIRDWVDYFAALGPPLVAVLTLFGLVGVGWWQATLQQRQVAIQYFTERYKLYKAVAAYVHTVIDTNGSLNPDALHILRDATLHAEFMFGEAVIAYIDKVIALSEEVGLAKHDLESQMIKYEAFQLGLRVDWSRHPGVAAANDNFAALLSKLTDLHRELNSVFRPYLTLEHSLPWYSHLEQYLDRITERADEKLKVERYGS